MHVRWLSAVNLGSVFPFTLFYDRQSYKDINSRIILCRNKQKPEESVGPLQLGSVFPENNCSSL